MNDQFYQVVCSITISLHNSQRSFFQTATTTSTTIRPALYIKDYRKFRGLNNVCQITLTLWKFPHPLSLSSNHNLFSSSRRIPLCLSLHPLPGGPDRINCFSRMVFWTRSQLTIKPRDKHFGERTKNNSTFQGCQVQKYLKDHMCL